NIDDNFDDLMENGKYITQNRCIEPNILSFRKTAMQRYIVALVDNFEYRAAYEILKDNEFLFSAEALNLLKYAVLRQDDNNEYLKMKDINNQFSFTKDSEAKKACDYYCILSNKAKTGELSYFVLLLKPLIEYIAKSYTGSIDKNEAIACLNDYYSKKINSYYIEKPSYNIEEYVAIMRHKKLDEETVNKFDEIRDYLVARNELAHDLQRVEYLDTNSALKKLRFLLKRTYGNKIKDNSLNIYDLINQKIKDTL
ncbi:MAG: hypothetical protein GYA87_00435, partial [Christensenellaceae bacterium]|nr:hypothetical protein [Christensenellaceae bacterium]